MLDGLFEMPCHSWVEFPRGNPISGHEVCVFSQTEAPTTFIVERDLNRGQGTLAHTDLFSLWSYSRLLPQNI